MPEQRAEIAARGFHLLLCGRRVARTPAFLSPLSPVSPGKRSFLFAPRGWVAVSGGFSRAGPGRLVRSYGCRTYFAGPMRWRRIAQSRAVAPESAHRCRCIETTSDIQRPPLIRNATRLAAQRRGIPWKNPKYSLTGRRALFRRIRMGAIRGLPPLISSVNGAAQ